MMDMEGGGYSIHCKVIIYAIPCDSDNTLTTGTGTSMEGGKPWVVPCRFLHFWNKRRMLYLVRMYVYQKKSKKSTMKVLLLLTAAIRQFAAGTPNLITS